MGYCTADEHHYFLYQCPIFGRMLVEDGTILLEYWSSVSDKEQYRRFKSRMADPMRRRRFPPINLESIIHWEECPRAKDEMFVHTDIDVAPWNVVESEGKRKARINMIYHLPDSTPYEHVERPTLELPKRPSSNGYRRTDRVPLHEVPDYASTLKTSSEQKRHVDPEDEEIL